MWGIVPAAGMGTRIQPLAFSKELLPVGTRRDGPRERPCAVAEYLVERMVLAGARRVCFVIAPGKSDILRYFGAGSTSAEYCYRVQSEPRGLCDAVFQALAVVPDDEVAVVGLPDTIWYPRDGLRHLPDDRLGFLLFPVDHPERFDAVLHDAEGRVQEVQVKRAGDAGRWVWGAFKAPACVLRELQALWIARDRRDEYFGTLVNAWLATGGTAVASRAGETYVDVGTPEGWREAIALVEGRAALALQP